LIARDVAAASGTGLLLNPNTEGAPDAYSCDDNTVPPDDSLPTDDWAKIPESYFSGGTLAGGLDTTPTTGGTPSPDPLGDMPRLGRTEGTDGSGNPQTTLSIPPSMFDECPHPTVQWFKATYKKSDGTFGFVPIDNETASNLVVTGDLYGLSVSAGVVCNGIPPFIPTFPYEPIPVPSGYAAIVRVTYTTRNLYYPEAAGETTLLDTYTSYGPYGIEWERYETAGSYPAGTGRTYWNVYITNSAGNKTIIFGTNEGWAYAKDGVPLPVDAIYPLPPQNGFIKIGVVPVP
jgi:hypothetical protein